MSKDWHLEEVFSMDESMIEMLSCIRQPIVGVIAALSHGKNERKENDEQPSTDFFMKQPPKMG